MVLGLQVDKQKNKIFTKIIMKNWNYRTNRKYSNMRNTRTRRYKSPVYEKPLSEKHVITPKVITPKVMTPKMISQPNKSLNKVFKSPTKSKSKSKKGIWSFLGFKSLH